MLMCIATCLLPHICASQCGLFRSVLLFSNSLQLWTKQWLTVSGVFQA
jgi:hypothetical protein